MRTGELSYRERLPAPELAAIAACLWVQRVAPDGPAYLRRTVPNGAVEISAALDAGADPVPVVTGPQTGPLLRRLPPGATLVGIRFHPGTAPAALGVAAAELVDRELPLAELWGRPSAMLAERIGEAGAPWRAAATLAEGVRAGLGRGPAPDPVVAAAVARLRLAPGGGEPPAVGSLASELWISGRQLRRRTIAATGLGPATLHRLLRFQGFLALAQTMAEWGSGIPGPPATPAGGLARAAALAGYADQAHLTRECRRLAGLPPRAFLSELREHCRGRHDHAASLAPLLGPAWAG